PAVADLLDAAGYAEVRMVKDLTGRERVVRGARR
ncbi:MAG: peptide chain release factor N(5)-glutamine methyltransferase, partial [Gemmatimonadetes bacterium]|nr:peptide chain release factor N(5)-glutamine methyltransferase [Gemmatimonadota bacterium]NIQ54440.1 peptide chain release factor N(5)-glutamine methyltransferase [Gemmatimonadota bacterium]NIU74648.1 peptide chain release factor N(5)-glutamine methyltransferase [Gammaproteobacteria bacterium]NIX44579.1 peptide chain release factor N(5)-glutamine methyltransferase [Gemmatimonadota bacterium]NIY08789.1 peptide chain release factor N(5)-glutamine methyltransferase [Gemmatimonadota bacterium]